MKVIIAGGRDYVFVKTDGLILESLHLSNRFTEIVSGGCSGADENGELFAVTHKLPIKYFNADWKLYGKSAGPIRNKLMAEYADAIILFPGGKGTASMRSEAKKAELEILYDAENEK